MLLKQKGKCLKTSIWANVIGAEDLAHDNKFAVMSRILKNDATQLSLSFLHFKNDSHHFLTLAFFNE
jgi:hypothetical protein